MTANTYTLLAPDRQPYQSATSGALGGYRPGRVCGRLSDSKWSRSTPPSSGLRTGYELGQVFGHYGGKASASVIPLLTWPSPSAILALAREAREERGGCGRRDRAFENPNRSVTRYYKSTVTATLTV